MRRLFVVAALGMMLSSAAACGTAPTGTTGAPAAGPSVTSAASPTVASNTKTVCAAFEKAIDSDRMKALGVPIGEMLVYQQANNTAKVKDSKVKISAELNKLSADIGKIGATATDASVKAAFSEVSANIAASAKDLKFLANVKKIEDFEKPFTAELTSWVTPIAGTCSLT